jgi:hypothetical protein
VKKVMFLESIYPEFVVLANYLKMLIVTSILKAKPTGKIASLLRMKNLN